MERILFKIGELSIIAGIMIVAVIFLRFLMRKAPKWIRCLLWGIVALRMVIPFSMESPFGVLPDSGATRDRIASWTGAVPDWNALKEESYPDLTGYGEPKTLTGVEGTKNSIQSDAGKSGESKNPVLADEGADNGEKTADSENAFVTLIGALWLCGTAIMFVYAIVSRHRIRAMLREAVLLKGNIYLCDAVDSPFLSGVISPRIYLPSGMDEGQMDYVLAHEYAHLKRGDHYWKLLGYLILCFYWFHPLVWLAYVLFCRDIELACDEKAVRDMGVEERKNYSKTLLSLSMQKRLVIACPLAFGEVGVKERVRNVLRFQKTSHVLAAGAVTVCIAAAVLFLTCRPHKEILAFRIAPDADAQTIFLSETQIAPKSRKLTIWAGDGIDEGAVVLIDAATGELCSYAAPVYFEKALPVEFQVEKGKWYLVGMMTGNETGSEKVVTAEIRNVTTKDLEEEAPHDLFFDPENPDKGLQRRNAEYKASVPGEETEGDSGAVPYAEHMAEATARLSVFRNGLPEPEEAEVTWQVRYADNLYRFLGKLDYEEGSFDNIPEITVFFDDGVIALIDLDKGGDGCGRVELRGMDQIVKLSTAETLQLERLVSPYETREYTSDYDGDPVMDFALPGNDGVYIPAPREPETGDGSGDGNGNGDSGFEMKHLTELPAGELAWLEVTENGVDECRRLMKSK